MGSRRFIAGALSAALLAGGAVLASPGIAGADGITPVSVSCTGIPIIGTTTGSVDLDASDDVDPVAPGGSVTNTLNVPVPVDDVPISVTVEEVKITVPVPAGVTVDGVTFSASSFTGTTWAVTGSNLVATLTGSIPLGNGAPVPSVPDVIVATTVGGSPRTVEWKVPSQISAKADAGFLGKFTAICTPTDANQVIISTTVANAATVPGAPASVAAVAAEGQASLTWAVPGTNGGSGITQYLVTPIVAGVPGTPIAVPAGTESLTIDGLANGTSHTFTVAAENAVGVGPASAASSAVTPQWWLPWSSGPVAVTELVTWLTGTAPTTAQRNAWVGQLDAGTKLPGDLVAELRTGPDALDNVDPTVRLYKAYLTRVPDGAGLNYWLGRKRSGYTLNKISRFFSSSPEFVSLYGSLTNRQFVDRIYVNVLGRTGDPAGVTYWTAQLDQGKKSRGQVMINYSESPEFVGDQVGTTSSSVIFIHVLGRTPSTVEWQALAARLDGGDSVPEVLREAFRTEAFAIRAG